MMFFVLWTHCRYGPEAAVVTEQAMGTAGHVFATAWTVTKVRRALNPSKFKTSKTGLLKTAAKAAIGSGKGNT
jgi:spartin